MAFQTITAGPINNEAGAVARGGNTTVSSVNPALTSKRENVLAESAQTGVDLNGTLGAVDDIQRLIDQNGNRINTQNNTFAVSLKIEPIQNIKTTEDSAVYTLLDSRFYDGYVEDFTKRPFTPATDVYNVVAFGTDAAANNPSSRFLIGGKMNTGN